MTVDLLFLTWNRAEFTEVALGCLARNTNWRLVNRLVVYDDGSDQDQLEQIVAAVPGPADIGVPIDFRHTVGLGPPGVMLDYLGHDPTEVFVKIDNDIAVPGGWLEALTGVWEDRLDLLGMEIGMPRGLSSLPWPEEEAARTWEPCRNIGGVGMMRSSALLRQHPPLKPNGRFGFTEYQHTHKTASGWIFPEINAPCLDRVPVDPFASWSAGYVERGWQREWWQYPQTADRYWSWLKGGAAT
jgi:hypothetical protein